MRHLVKRSEEEQLRLTGTICNCSSKQYCNVCTPRLFATYYKVGTVMHIKHSILMQRRVPNV